MPNSRLYQAQLLAGLLASSASGALAQFDESVARRAFGGIQLALSPDGRVIALSHQGAICRMPSAGGTLTRLTQGEGWDVEPAWSPDGKQIVFINAPGFNTGPVRLIAAADGTLVKLPKDVLARRRLQFHHDGKRLLGMFALTGQPDRLQWFDLASGELRAINTAPLDAHQRGAMKWALSPDGATILFVTFQDRPGEQGGNNGPSADLWRVSSAGGEPRKLTRWPSRIYGLCWDAEGRGAFVVTDRGVAHSDLWHIPLNRDSHLASPPEDASLRSEASARQARKITFGQADEDWPSVSADGRWLLHTENQERATALARVDLTSGQRQTLGLDRVEFPGRTSKLRLVLTDAHTGDPLFARLSLKQQGGKLHFPLGALYRLTSGVGKRIQKPNGTSTITRSFCARATRAPTSTGSF